MGETKQQKKEEEDEKETKKILGIFTRQHFTLLCVLIGVIVLLVVVTVTSLVVTKNSSSDNSDSMIPFPTDGDMLEFLLQNGEIPEMDGLYITWNHATNSKDETNKALESDIMVLEADVNVQGHNTINETDIPIMAHPPDVYSDNTLEEWLDAVLKSKKGIKLDLKSLQALEPTLDILRVRNQTGINRPVWINADIFPGPNVPSFWPVVNSTRFFELIQMKFPDVTISPGWKVLYLPIFPNVTYTEAMVKQMYSAVQHLPQKVTFPVMAVMAKKGWPHLSWLLSQSPRFTLTLWQGTDNPTVEDLLFIRDNSHPKRIYYDIYEPVLSQFKEAAKLRDRLRRFYPGGDIVDYFKPENGDGLNILWEVVTDRDSLLSIIQDSPAAMLVISVISGRSDPEIPTIEDSQPELPLQECLNLILASPNPWGIYLRVKSRRQLAATLHLLQEAYDSSRLHHPVWINMDISHGVFNIQGYITGQEFLKTTEQIFPYLTLAPSWPREALDQGYTLRLVDDMMELFGGVWQDVSLQLLAEHLEKSKSGFINLLQSQPRFSLTVENKPGKDGLGTVGLKFALKGERQRTFYNAE